MEKNLYRIANSILTAVICLFLLGRKIGIAKVEQYHFVLALVMLLALTAFCYLKLKGRLLLSISVTVCLWVTFFVVGTEKMSLFWESYVAGLHGEFMENLPWGIFHESVQVLWISVGVFLLQLLMERVFVLKIFVGLGLLSTLFFDMFSEKALEHLTVVCILLYLIVVYVEWIQRHWKKQKGNKRTEYLVWILPFLVCYLFFMWLMPAPEEPYDWKFVKDAYSRTRDRFIQVTQNIFRGDGEDFGAAVCGFSEDGKLLGGVFDTNKELFHIQGERNLKTNVYLVGKVYDTFTGQQWLQKNQDTINDRELDALETAYAVYAYDEDYRRDYMYGAQLHITHKYFNSGYLFVPLKTWEIDHDGLYEASGSNLLLREKAGYGTEYDVKFWQLNIDHDEFYEFLEMGYEPNAELWERLRRQYYLSGYTLEDMDVRREAIYGIYGQKAVLSKEAQEYLEKLTAHAETDVEKLKCIEAALTQLTYNAVPGALPEEITTPEAFLDYFLFESKQGYCSYFASAFVLLARAEGIPARYVEGFCVPMQGQAATVYSGMSHAWPEVYIDGVGWIPFEPTPGYAAVRYTPWEIQSREKKENISITLEELEEEEEVTEELNVELLEEAEQQTERSIFKILVYTLLFVLLAGFCIYRVDGTLSRIRYGKMSLEEKLLVQLKRNVQLLGRLGYPRGEEETLEELEQRAWAVINYEEEAESWRLQFLRIYEEMVYGNYPVSEEMLQKVLEEQQLLLELLKKWKRWTYIYCKLTDR